MLQCFVHQDTSANQQEGDPKQLYEDADDGVFRCDVARVYSKGHIACVLKWQEHQDVF